MQKIASYLCKCVGLEPSAEIITLSKKKRTGQK